MAVQPSQSDQDIRTNQAVDLDTVLRRYLADPTASWGLGTYGAVAEFHRTSDEPASIDTGATLQVVTARGALRIGSTQEIRVCAYEQPGHASESWSHVLTLCLPFCTARGLSAHSGSWRGTARRAAYPCAPAPPPAPALASCDRAHSGRLGAMPVALSRQPCLRRTRSPGTIRPHGV